MSIGSGGKSKKKMFPGFPPGGLSKKKYFRIVRRADGVENVQGEVSAGRTAEKEDFPHFPPGGRREKTKRAAIGG